MDLADNVEFRNRLVALSEVFDVKLSPARAALYFEALRDLPFPAVAQAMNQAVKVCKFLPRPAEIRQLAVGDDEDRAEVAWMALRRAMAEGGAYRSLACDATLGEAIVAVFGSWPEACQLELSPEMWSSKRKEFGRVYRVLANRALDGTRYLPGICEQQNAGRLEWQRFVQVYAIEGEAGRCLSGDEAQARRALHAAQAHGFRSIASLLPESVCEIEREQQDDAS